MRVSQPVMRLRGGMAGQHKTDNQHSAFYYASESLVSGAALYIESRLVLGSEAATG